MMQPVSIFVAMAALFGPHSMAFVVAPPQHSSKSSTPCINTVLYSTTSTPATSVLSLSLEKPLGMTLEEVEENQPHGVYILELTEEGSAAGVPNANQILVGSKLAKVMGTDVTRLAFDDVMELLVTAPSTVDLEVLVAAEDQDNNSATNVYQVGTPVTVTVLQDGQPDLTLDAKVGDNLRQVLINNNVEVYRGLKAKLGNCGGGGQCGFCAVDIVDSEGWEDRSDYEAKKLKNRPNARLSCLNNILGPVTIQM